MHVSSVGKKLVLKLISIIYDVTLGKTSFILEDKIELFLGNRGGLDNLLLPKKTRK